MEPLNGIPQGHADAPREYERRLREYFHSLEGDEGYVSDFSEDDV